MSSTWYKKKIAAQFGIAGMDLTDPGARFALARLVHEIVKVEALYSRVRDRDGRREDFDTTFVVPRGTETTPRHR